MTSSADSSSPSPRETVRCGCELTVRYLVTEVVESFLLLLLVCTVGSLCGAAMSSVCDLSWLADTTLEENSVS